MSLAMPAIAYWDELSKLLGDKFDSIDNDIIYLNVPDEETANEACDELEEKYPRNEFDVYWDDDCDCWAIEVIQ